jgi:hypothetical protein
MCLSTSLYSTGKKAEEPVPFDADLFKKDIQAVSPSIEFLYWVVQESCVDYALKMQHPAWGSTSSYAQGKYKSATFDIDPGFRLGLNFFRAPKLWEMKWQYTRLGTSGKNSCSKPAVSSEYLTGTWPQILPAPLSGATSHIHMNYNTFDMTIDRYFIPNPHLRLRLIGGAVVAWINQDWKVQYFDAALRSTTIRNQWRFIGGGFKLGTMVDWYLTQDIYITAMGMTGALMGSYRNLSKQTTTYQPAGDDNPNIPIRDTIFKDTRPAFTAQVVFGPSWQKNFKNNRVEVFAGYELNLWFNLQEIYRSTAGSASAAKETWINSSMMALQGLTARVTVDF